jgi:pimeloyl-[acyl-carrier protein] methyl ester esterase
MIPQWMMDAMMLGSYGGTELRARFAHAVATLPSAVLRARTLETLHVDKRNLLAGIACPALCLTGRHDRLIPAERAEEIMAGLPDCRHVALDAPHMFLETHATLAAAAITTFCAALDQTAVPALG